MEINFESLIQEVVNLNKTDEKNFQETKNAQERIDDHDKELGRISSDIKQIKQDIKTIQ